MNAQDTNPVVKPEICVSRLALDAIEDSGEALDEILKRHMTRQYPHGYFSMQAHKLNSGAILLIGFDPENNTVGVFTHTEFIAEMLKEQVP